jgi:shikimate dehydrogenase
VTRLGVLGWPVGHSRSPAIQNAALAAAGLAPGWRYQLLPVPPERFEETVRALPAAGFRGANVTIPHKHAALACADTATPSARAIGAANTLLFADGAIDAHNTDAPALIDALPFEMAGRSALVLGAGGSARAAVWALLDAGAGEVRVWNRTPERARALAEELGATAVSEVTAADVLVHCTSSGLDTPDSMLDTLPVSSGGLEQFGCVADFVYARTETALVRAAREQRVPAVGGIELLIGQGALAFELFTGRAAPADVMAKAA